MPAARPRSPRRRRTRSCTAAAAGPRRAVRASGCGRGPARRPSRRATHDPPRLDDAAAEAVPTMAETDDRASASLAEVGRVGVQRGCVAVVVVDHRQRRGRASSAPRTSNPDQAGCEKLVDPTEEITPSALAGPGVSRPTTRTSDRSMPVASSTARTPARGPRPPLPALGTRLGISSRRSTRNRPAASTTVALFAVPPLSRPTATHALSSSPWTLPIPMMHPASAPTTRDRASASSTFAPAVTGWAGRRPRTRRGCGMSGLTRYRTFLSDSALWTGFRFRAGDIVISPPPKCGTTWMQMLSALLVFGHRRARPPVDRGLSVARRGLR